MKQWTMWQEDRTMVYIRLLNIGNPVNLVNPSLGAEATSNFINKE